MIELNYGETLTLGDILDSNNQDAQGLFLQNRPFDGFIFVVNDYDAALACPRPSPFPYLFRTITPVSQDSDVYSLTRMATVPNHVGKYTDNFLLLKATGLAVQAATPTSCGTGGYLDEAAYLDYFDDNQWNDRILPSLHLWARAAYRAGCVGIAIDPEVDGGGCPGPWAWKYYSLREHPGKYCPYDTQPPHPYECATCGPVSNPEDYYLFYVMPNYHQDGLTPAEDEARMRAQVRLRGGQCVDAIEQEFPDRRVKILWLAGYEILSEVWENGVSTDPRSRYFLFNSFLDGMLQNLNEGNELIDGDEAYYSTTTTTEAFQHPVDARSDGSGPFGGALRLVGYDLPSAGQTALQAKFVAQGRISSGLMMNKMFPGTVACNGVPGDCAEWYEHNLYYALGLSDEYVWYYTECTRANGVILSGYDWWRALSSVPEDAKDGFDTARQRYDSAARFGSERMPHGWPNGNPMKDNVVITLSGVSNGAAVTASDTHALSATIQAVPFLTPAEEIALTHVDFLIFKAGALTEKRSIVYGTPVACPRTEALPVAGYAELTPGEYEFCVRAFDDDNTEAPGAAIQDWSGTSGFVRITVVPAGACCFTNGSCQVLGEAACTAAGGHHWAGPDTACTPSPCVCRGDMDCDGSVGLSDVDYISAAIGGQCEWAGLYAARHGAQPPCPFANCDVNGDGNVDFADIDPFVALIPSSCP